MGWLELYDHQREALNSGAIHNGCIICGGVGSGKSRAGLAYYYILQGGDINADDYVRMRNPKDLYIITTARKRDTMEWEEELLPFLIPSSLYSAKVTIDSWNNIGKYKDVKNAFFIFDEQRVVGYGVWARSFIRISKSNQWILLSATPGDKWEDYTAVFIANGFFRNKTHYEDQHMYISYRTGYKKVERYFNTRKLVRLREQILVDMPDNRHTQRLSEDIRVEYDKALYKSVDKTRWNPYTNKPIKNASEYCQTLRRIVNTDESRQTALLELFEKHPKMIIFYNYNYELDILRSLYYGDDVVVAEWNGAKHEPIPDAKEWVYLVQYTAGAEGWNCIKTDTIVFYSQNYSYKIVEQAKGRIDRINTPYTYLYYYTLKSKSPIDISIARAVAAKKQFNEGRYFNRRNS